MNINTYTVFGSGAWGTALANTIALNYGKVTLYSRNISQSYDINHYNQNNLYLPGILLSDNIFATSILKEAAKSNIWLIVIPCKNLREFLKNLRSLDYRDKTIIICSKGLEYNSLKFPSEIIEEELPGVKIGILSGPNFAIEVAKSIPSASVLALKNLEYAHEIGQEIGSKLFHLNITTDLAGVAVGGATKNIIALACGLARGMKFGDNTIANFITMGLEEITRFALSKGGSIETLNGLAGLGDLVLSCTSNNSRNFKFGFELGQGYKIEELLKNNITVEGYYSTKAIYELSLRCNLHMPITSCMYNILYQGLEAEEAIDLLLLKY